MQHVESKILRVNEALLLCSENVSGLLVLVQCVVRFNISCWYDGLNFVGGANHSQNSFTAAAASGSLGRRGLWSGNASSRACMHANLFE